MTWPCSGSFSPSSSNFALRVSPSTFIFCSGLPSVSSAWPAKASGPIGNNNGKILLNGPYANIYNDIGISFFGLIVIAAIFGTSILRDFQRDTIQILFTKPISKFAYLGGRWAGSFVATVFAFSGLIFGEFLGTFAPGQTTPVSARTIFPGTCNRSSPSSSSRFSFWVLSSSLSPLSRARFSLSTCRAQRSSCSTLSASMPSAPRVRSSTSGPAS